MKLMVTDSQMLLAAPCCLWHKKAATFLGLSNF